MTIKLYKLGILLFKILLMFSFFILILSFYIANALLIFNLKKWVDLGFFDFFSNYWINLDFSWNHITYGSILFSIFIIFSIHVNRKCIFSKSCSKEPSNND